MLLQYYSLSYIKWTSQIEWCLEESVSIFCDLQCKSLFLFSFSGELGDYDALNCRTGYLSEYQFFPGQVCFTKLFLLFETFHLYCNPLVRLNIRFTGTCIIFIVNKLDPKIIIIIFFFRQQTQRKEYQLTTKNTGMSL